MRISELTNLVRISIFLSLLLEAFSFSFVFVLCAYGAERPAGPSLVMHKQGGNWGWGWVFAALGFVLLVSLAFFGGGGYRRRQRAGEREEEGGPKDKASTVSGVPPSSTASQGWIPGRIWDICTLID